VHDDYCDTYFRRLGSPGIVVETVFGDTFRFSPNLAIPGFQGLVTFAINMIPGEPKAWQASQIKRKVVP
jgi:hypothetical protein